MKDEATGVIGSTVSWVLTVSQANELFELIQIILSSIVSLITICYIVYKWYKRASSDGEITKEEVKELSNEIKEEVEKNDRIKR